jgi:intraflagellar transport protein 140
MLNETIMHSGMCGDIVVQQVSSDRIAINVVGDSPFIQEAGLLVKGISVGNNVFLVWSGKTASVFQVDTQRKNSALLGSFRCNAKSMRISNSQYISDDVIFAVDGDLVTVLNFAGVQRFSLSFSESEGLPDMIDLNSKYLVIMTTKGYIKVFDVGKPTKPVAIGSPGRFNDPYAASSELSLGIRAISANCKGNMLAVLTDRVEGALKIRHPDSRLHVFDQARGTSHTYDFAEQSRFPTRVSWDTVDDRLCVCDAQLLRTAAAAAAELAPSEAKEAGDKASASAADDYRVKMSDSTAEHVIAIFFVTSEYGVRLQDSFPRQAPYGNLLGIAVPRIYFGSLPPTDESADVKQSFKVHSKLMRDFVGLRGIDDAVKAALLEVSFNLSLGKLDEAYRAVKVIDSPAIWENMANKCVKTKRIDVAEVCLGNMGNARGAAALRKARLAPDSSAELQAGILALQLGQLDDAAKLFVEAKRFDYLNKMYQAAGQWEKAIRVASTSDRLHMKTTHFQYAKHLESVGAPDDAIEHFELSDTHRIEVPRMLYSQGRMEALEDYVNSSKDILLFKWWAAYLESQERFDLARKYYARASDFLSLVRLACFQGDFQTAADIVHESGDAAASYHFARQLEAKGELRESINYYAASGCYNHAIRLAKAYGLDAELMRFATKSTQSLMLDCGAYFESKGDIDNAVQLYHKGGDLPRALDLCFKAGAGRPGGGGASAAVLDMLNVIAKDLGADSSPQTLARCAEFLMQSNEYGRAVDLYIMAKRYRQAVDMCAGMKVPLTEEMAEKLTPPAEEMDANERKDILKELAGLLKKQGSFTLASKKYTLAGDRIRAMKCLLRAGDTKAVIQFATISRSAEIYKLAGNYLQQMNWRESVDIMKAIITFYTKAQAFEQLAGFYDSCAQVRLAARFYRV